MANRSVIMSHDNQRIEKLYYTWLEQTTSSLDFRFAVESSGGDWRWNIASGQSNLVTFFCESIKALQCRCVDQVSPGVVWDNELVGHTSWRVSSNEHKERISRHRRTNDKNTDDENEALDSQNEDETGSTDTLRYRNKLVVKRFHVLQRQLGTKIYNVKQQELIRRWDTRTWHHYMSRDWRDIFLVNHESSALWLLDMWRLIKKLLYFVCTEQTPVTFLFFAMILCMCCSLKKLLKSNKCYVLFIWKCIEIRCRTYSKIWIKKLQSQIEAL